MEKTQTMTMKKQTLNIKNYFLLSTFILSSLHTIFRGSKVRVDWYLLIDYTRRIDFAVMYTTTAINFFILAYCLKFPKGIREEIKDFILIVVSLDLLHLILLSKLRFGFVKICLAIIIYYIIKLIRKYG